MTRTHLPKKKGGLTPFRNFILVGILLGTVLYVSYVRLGEEMAYILASLSEGLPSAAARDAFCTKNPYLSSLNLSHNEIQDYQRGFAAARENALKFPASKHDHERFRIFQELAPCSDLACVGGRCGDDSSKIVCGLRNLQHDNCTVYSIGGNNNWNFENDLLRRTKCHIHTFDCTGPQSRFKVPKHDRLHFHYECLHGGNATKPGPLFFTLDELTQKHHHSQIDLLKMDIEGFEYGVFESFQQTSEQHLLPMQVLVELHYRTHIVEVSPRRDYDFMTEADLVDWAQKLFQLGYAVTKRDDNRYCHHCTELTLMRVYC